MHSSPAYNPRSRPSLSPSQKDRNLVDTESPLYRCVSSTNQKIRHSSQIDEGYDWGKSYRSKDLRKSDVNLSPNLAKSTPSLHITTYRETVTLPVEYSGYFRSRSISPAPLTSAISPSRNVHLTSGSTHSSRIKSLSPVSANKTSSSRLSYLNLSPSPLRRSNPARQSLPAKLPSSTRSSIRPHSYSSYSRSSGIYSDYMDDDQLSSFSSMTGNTSLASTRSGNDPLLRIAPGSPNRGMVPRYLLELRRHHTAGDILQDEMRHGQFYSSISIDE